MAVAGENQQQPAENQSDRKAADVPQENPRPMLLMLHGTQGFKDGCSLQNDALSLVLAAYFASLGYVVVLPDYIGLKASGPPTGFPHPYLVGQATAVAALDAVRAVGSLDKDQRNGVVAAPRLLAFGGSQGGHAALWVDRLAPYYARELTLLGMVATVPPSDLLGHSVRGMTELVPATKNLLAVLGASSSWYGVESRLQEVLLPPFDVSVGQALAASCDADPPTVPAGHLREMVSAAARAGQAGRPPYIVRLTASPALPEPARPAAPSPRGCAPAVV